MSEDQTTGAAPTGAGEAQTQAGTAGTPTANATGGGQQPGESARTFTQEDLNRIVPQRAEQMARQLLRERGFESVDDLDKRLRELDEFKRERQTELEKAQETVQRATERAQRAETERDEAIQKAQSTLIRAALMAEASALNVAHPEDAYHLADLAGVAIGEDGITVTGAADAVRALVDDGRLPLRGKPPAPKLDGGAGSGERSDGGPQLTAEELEIARKLRVSPEEYAKHKQ